MVCLRMDEAALVSSRYSVCRLNFFFQKDHRRTSPVSVVVISECFISECSVFYLFFFCILISEIPPSFAIFMAEIPIFHKTPHTHTHTHAFSNPVQYCGITFQFKYQEDTRHRVAPRLLMKVKSRFNCVIM